MDKPTFLATLQSEHAQWEALLAEVGDSRMTQPNSEPVVLARPVTREIDSCLARRAG